MSRRSKRRERRALKRQKTPETIEDVVSHQNLYNATFLASKHVKWKQSVQRYLINIFFRNYSTRKAILSGKDIRKGFINFSISERGKKRDIQSVHFSERVVQKSLCANVLNPRFYPTLIKENSASQKSKGTLFATQLFEKQLREFLRKNGKGYILTIDFKKYFENIQHQPLFDFYDEKLTDKIVKKLCKDFVSAFEKGLGLGSEASQFNAIIYINKIDHYIKHNFKYYGRYMDDSYIISEDKEKLKEFLQILNQMYSELGIIVNHKKTKIVSLNQYFVFLKTRYKVVENNKIIKKPSRSSITRNRRRFRKMVKLVNNGQMSIEAFKKSFNSFCGTMKRRNARRSIYKLKKEIMHDLRIQY